MRYFNHKRTLGGCWGVLLGCLLVWVAPAQGQQKYQIDSKDSFIECSIRYTLIGKYEAAFDYFLGTLLFDANDITKSAVRMEVNTASIHSKHPRLDRIVRSPRLLDVQKYPAMIFKSQTIQRYKKGYWVTGLLTVHGVTQTVTFPFTLSQKGDVLEAQGEWVIQRKDFNVIWHKYLDQGGIIVGNYVKIGWKIRARKE